MKPKNFPKRKLLRKLGAKYGDIFPDEVQKQLADARNIRTKKRRDI